MKPSRFTEEQIIGILREQDAGMATAEVCRKYRSGATFYKWRPSTAGWMCVRRPAAQGAGG
jgi:putative transposase